MMEQDENYAIDLWEHEGALSGIKIRIEYDNKRFSLIYLTWGAGESHESERRRVKKEQWVFNEENTQRLMDYYEVKTGKELLELLDSLYISHVTTIDTGLKEVCESFNITCEYKEEYVFITCEASKT